MLMCDRQKILGEGGFAIHHTKILGVGGFGTVFEGTWGGVKVAVKRILKSNAVTTEQEEMALKMLDHTNVIKLFHVEEDQDFKMFVLELCDASMDKLFLQESDKNKYRGPMPPETEVLLQLAKGLAYIHQMGLVHRDIKPQNVLISFDSATQQVVMKWADFGFSKQVNERGTFTMSGVRGTYDYFAPEILKLLDEDSSAENQVQKRGTVKSDVFAEGLVFGYFLSEGVHPFGSSSHQILVNVRKKEPANLPQTEKLRNIITEMLEKEPDNRITSSDVVDRFTNILKNSQQMFTLLAEGNPSVEELGKLIQEGVDINVKDPNGLTPLLHVAGNKIGSDKVVEIVSFLIQHGANVNSMDSKGKNALLLWCKSRKQHENKSYLAIINLFVNHGIHINSKDKCRNNALILLCESYQNEDLIDSIRLLIEIGIDINWKNEDKDNALTRLCRFYENENLIDIIRLLVENGIDINCKNKYEYNALILLCTWYQNANLIDIIRLFIENGIDVNCKTVFGDNALPFLCANYKNENLIDIIRLFIENEIEVNSKNEGGDNALTLLCNYYKNENLIDITKFLIKSGFNVTKETRDFFQRKYFKQNRNEVLQLLDSATNNLNNASLCSLS